MGQRRRSHDPRRALAHVFHGVNGRIPYDMGDFLDDYAGRSSAADRSWAGLLRDVRPLRTAAGEALPIKIDYCATDLAAGEEASWIADRFRSACRVFGADVRANDEGWLDVENRRT
jgi:hypothetical protein